MIETRYNALHLFPHVLYEIVLKIWIINWNRILVSVENYTFAISKRIWMENMDVYLGENNIFGDWGHNMSKKK